MEITTAFKVSDIICVNIACNKNTENTEEKFVAKGSHKFSFDVYAQEKQSYKYIQNAKASNQNTVKQTANGEVSVLDDLIAVADKQTWRVTLKFPKEKGEVLTGLGQHEEGVFNYAHQTEYLYQNNMIISLPVIISSLGYAICVDANCAMAFERGEDFFTLTLESAINFNVYLTKQPTVKEAVMAVYKITGMPKLLPKWAFGYMQSKEKYESSAELIQTAKRFKEENIPLSCIVQDWHTWEEGLWGEKHPDKKRFPSIPTLTETLHKQGVKLLVSIWPNMAENSKDYKEFERAGKLLPNSNVYNAFDEEAGKLYFKQCNEDWFSGGVDGFWCDNTEPFSDADWNGEEKRTEEERYKVVVELSQKSMDETQLNAFGLYNAKNIYENWVKTSNKRVVNLTRSGYLGAQKYGVILWSGDICATYKTMANQIAEGIKASMCGFPFWTLDIGGFFTVKDKWENRGCNCNTVKSKLWFWSGDYEEGVQDLGYRELYTRWLQFGCFLPVFRSHGTDTPREPWQFGKRGELFYDTIVDYINLRYKLMPYIYATAAQSCREGMPIMRSLLFEFGITDEQANKEGYMFGDAFYIQPITKPMYYGKNSKVLNHPKKVEVRLPKNVGWYDWFTKKYHYNNDDDEVIHRDCPLQELPVYVKAGSIVPTKEGKYTYLNVYTGADGSFPLYFDDGDNYTYEEGNYFLARLEYSEESKTLTVAKKEGSYAPKEVFKVRYITKDGAINEDDFSVY